MNMDQGWMEKRQQDRISATANVTYRILDLREKEDILNYPCYSATTIIQLPQLAKKFHSYHAVMKDISEGGLSITGEQKFAVGDWLEISILPPKYDTPVTMLAEVKWVRSLSQSSKELNVAGVSTLALDRVSMDHLSRFLLMERKRLQEEKSS
jgi:Tfp pilus assembly protein PilZ